MQMHIFFIEFRTGICFKEKNVLSSNIYLYKNLWVPQHMHSIENIRRIFLNNEMFLFLGWDPFNSAFNILESLQTSKRGEMSRYIIVCFMIFGYFFSSSIVQNKSVSKLFTFMFGLYIPFITLLFKKKKFLHYFLCSRTINC